MLKPQVGISLTHLRTERSSMRSNSTADLQVRRLHRIVGMIMIIPFLGWALTGLVFFTKPGYTEAFESLSIKTYGNQEQLSFPVNEEWLEVRMFTSILGSHLLVKTINGSEHLNPTTLHTLALPPKQDIWRLVEDAISMNPKRYGNIVTVIGNQIETDKNVTIQLNWSQMLLSQEGRDTALINTMYKIHYLQWIGIEIVDRILGLLGLGLICTLAILGVLLLRTISHKRKLR